jgi:hypothetical protein
MANNYSLGLAGENVQKITVMIAAMRITIETSTDLEIRSTAERYLEDLSSLLGIFAQHDACERSVLSNR